MSDTMITSPNDAALELLRERERQLGAEERFIEIQAATIAARKEEVREMIATLSRRSRVRRLRAMPDARCPPAGEIATVGTFPAEGA